jgi:ABC-2 type transport system ATP-binding protein
MIHVENLVKTFGEVRAVDGVSFDVRAGEVFALVGPDGAGKTTTILMLASLIRPTSGTFALDGTSGIVFEGPSLDQELSAHETLELHGVLHGMPRRVRSERIAMLMQQFELWERRDALVRTLPGPMQRWLEIARGFLPAPKILFLDEPTLGLDLPNRSRLWTHIRNLNESERVTLFLATRDTGEAQRVAHRIATIDHGRVVHGVIEG